VVTAGHATRVGMFDDDAGRVATECPYAGQRCIGVGQIVVGQCFALVLLGGDQANVSTVVGGVQNSALVRIFTVAQFLALAVTWRVDVREGVADVAAIKIGADGVIVGGCVGEARGRQVTAQGLAGGAVVGTHVGEHAGIIA